jgi:hypothetical protein
LAGDASSSHLLLADDVLLNVGRHHLVALQRHAALLAARQWQSEQAAERRAGRVQRVCACACLLQVPQGQQCTGPHRPLQALTPRPQTHTRDTRHTTHTMTQPPTCSWRGPWSCRAACSRS